MLLCGLERAKYPRPRPSRSDDDFKGFRNVSPCKTSDPRAGPFSTMTYTSINLRFLIAQNRNEHHVLIVKKKKKKKKKTVRDKSRECHNHKLQSFPDPKRKRKSNKRKSNKRTKSTKIISIPQLRLSRWTQKTQGNRIVE